MITSRVNLTDRFDEITLAIEGRTVTALNEAAAEAMTVAEAAANTPKPIAHFSVVPAHNVGTGYASGVKAGPLTRIFEKGSLGQHTGRLKRGRRPAWEVNRGANPYTAHRHDDLAGKGVAPRHALTKGRAAGRKLLLRRLLSR